MKAKILLTVVIFLVVASTSHAQINKGDIFLGGSLHFENNNSSTDLQPADSYISNSFGINIQLGKVIKDNTVAGLMLSYYNYNGHNKISPDSNYNKSNSYSFGIFYRKYKKLAGNFYFFGEVDGIYSYQQGKEANSLYNIVYSKDIQQGINISFVPGVSYSISKRFAMELLMTNLLTIGYFHSKADQSYPTGTTPLSSSSKQNSFEINASLNSNFLSNFGIGFKFFLGNHVHTNATMP